MEFLFGILFGWIIATQPVDIDDIKTIIGVDSNVSREVNK
jgi:hypothetical protein